jgi:hypothetical protein
MFLTVNQIGLTLSSAETQGHFSTTPPKKIRGGAPGRIYGKYVRKDRGDGIYGYGKIY